MNSPFLLNFKDCIVVMNIVVMSSMYKKKACFPIISIPQLCGRING